MTRMSEAVIVLPSARMSIGNGPSLGRLRAVGHERSGAGGLQDPAPKKVRRLKSVYSDSITMIATNTRTNTGGTMIA